MDNESCSDRTMNFQSALRYPSAWWHPFFAKPHSSAISLAARLTRRSDPTLPLCEQVAKLSPSLALGDIDHGMYNSMEIGVGDIVIISFGKQET